MKSHMVTAHISSGVMVWCAMNGAGNLVLKRCPPKVKAPEYQTILASAKSFIRPRFGACFRPVITSIFYRPTRFKFQHDGASPHRAASTKKWLTSNQIRVFNDNLWPANSPDMNPIEHLWPLVGQKLVGHVYHGKEDLWAALQLAFASISRGQIITLYNSMPDRISALMAARGGHTRY